MAPHVQQETKRGHLMRSSLLLPAAFFLLAHSAHVSAQRHEIPKLNSCIKEFYDPEMYNYLTFKNSCAQSLSMVFVPKDGKGPVWTMELRPGGKESVGHEKGKAAKAGSFDLFVCQSGYVPVDDDGQVVSKPGSSFRCESKKE